MKRFRLRIQTQKQTTILCSRSACAPDPICPPECVMPPVIQTTSNWGDSHFHHEQTKIHALANTTLCSSSFFFTRKNNEPAYRAGSFTDLVQSQVPALKSPVMQMTTSCSFPLWCASSSSRIAKTFSIFLFFLFQPSQDEFLLYKYSSWWFLSHNQDNELLAN